MTSYAEMCCEVCGIHVSEAVMHRANPTGEKGCWRCEPCLGKPVSPVVLAVTDAFAFNNMLVAEGLPALDPEDLPLTPEQAASVRARRDKS